MIDTKGITKIITVVILLVQFPVFGKYFLNTTHTISFENPNPIVVEVEAKEEPTPTPSDPVEAYIYQVFGDDAERGIKMLRECENKTMNPEAINWNSNGSSDFGLWQVNSIHGYTHEQLADPYFNTDVAYKIYQRRGNTFSAWTCSYVIGDKSFWQI
jgi:hypothetical protein